MRKLSAASAIILLLTAVPSPASAQARHFPPDDGLRTMLRYLVEDTPVAGMVLGVLEADGSTRVVSYGSAGEGARPLGPQSRFEIGSITKTFTGALLADAVSRGLVSLDDPVQRHLPDTVRVPSRNGREITLLDLVTHHSGLPRLASNHTPADPDDPYADYSTATMYAFLSQHELRRDPGEEYEYSNLGFHLLGHALARASGTSLTNLMEERLLEPLGMSQTGYDLEREGAEWMARGHRRLAPTSFNTGGEARRGAGGLRSNVPDMLEYLKANVGPPANSLEELLREAHEPRVEIGDRGSQVGLAWVTTVAGERSIVEHGGGTGGFTSRIAFDPDRGVGYVLLANSRSYSDPTVNGLLALGPPLDFPEFPLSADVLSRIAGAYETDRGGRLYLRHEPEGYLTAQFSEYVRARLYSRSDTSFFMKHAPMRLTPVRADDGSVTGMVIERTGGDPASATRIGDSIPDPQTVRAGAVWSSLELEWANARRFVGIGALSVAVLAVLVLGVAWRRRVEAP